MSIFPPDIEAAVRAAIDEADRGLCEPLDIEAILAELSVELDPQGRRKERD